MKKLLSSSLAMLTLLGLLVSCGAPKASTTNTTSESSPASSSASESKAATSDQPDVIHISAHKGPTAIGMVKLMADQQQSSSKKYDINILASVDEVAPKLAKGELDIAAIPANLSSVLYNKTQQIQVMAINTLGVLYMIEAGENVKSVSDLKGKTIYAPNKGATPEYVLRHVLKSNQLDPDKDVTIEFKTEPAECIAALNANHDAVAMLPQPFVTAAVAKNKNFHVALDMTKEWDAIHQSSDKPSALVTGVVVARKAFIEEHPDLVQTFLEDYKASTSFINEQIDEAAKLVGSFDIVPEAIAKKAIPACNITYIDGQEMKDKLSGYLSVLHSENPKSVGGKLPDDGYYYQAK